MGEDTNNFPVYATFSVFSGHLSCSLWYPGCVFVNIHVVLKLLKGSFVPEILILVPRYSDENNIYIITLPNKYITLKIQYGVY